MTACFAIIYQQERQKVISHVWQTPLSDRSQFPVLQLPLFVNFLTLSIPPIRSNLAFIPHFRSECHSSPRLHPSPFHLFTRHPRMSVMNNNAAGHLTQNTAADPAQSQLNLSSHVDPHQLDHISIHSPRRILFLYGSQTGCAQDVAENAAREARRMHFSASVSSMDDYDRVRRPYCVFDLPSIR